MTVAQTSPNLIGIPKVATGGTTIWVPVYKDSSGNVIKLKNNLLPVYQVMMPLHILVYYITVQKAGYTDANRYAQFNAINNDSWRGVPAGNACIAKIVSEKGLFNNGSQDIEDLTYHVWVTDRTDGWKGVYPEISHAYKNGSSITPFGGFVGNLDSSGDKSAAGDTPIISTATINKSISFGSLGI